jgi:phosphate starvation-inducible PhoH-like protein
MPDERTCGNHGSHGSQKIKNRRLLKELCGYNDSNLHTIEGRFDVKFGCRGTKLSWHGDSVAVQQTDNLVNHLKQVIRSGKKVTPLLINTAIDKFTGVSTPKPSGLTKVVPKTQSQKRYLEVIDSHDIVFGVGAAGTGKTYLAVACALHALERKLVKRIIISRPALEAGEKLGFLPGTLMEKVDPYLRPIFDAMHDIYGFDRIHRLIDRGIIEVAPLAYMRGRTLSNAFVILDEAQNCSIEQIIMVLTRLGIDSRLVITGDPLQTDLPPRCENGLTYAARVLKDIEEIGVVRFDRSDVVRHPLVTKVLEAVEKDREKALEVT